MNRNLRRARRRAFVAAALLLGCLPAPAAAIPLISEVFYDAVGTDAGQSFVELYGPPGTDLTGFTIEGINGSNGEVTDSVALSGLIPPDGIFVLADDLGDGTTLVQNADLLASFDFQNGPDSIVLMLGASAVDAVGYGVFDAGEVFAGEGAPAEDPPAGWSLARTFADVDTDDNAVDFVAVETPTPGSAPFAVPEPSPGPLLAGGLLLLGGLRRRRA